MKARDNDWIRDAVVEWTVRFTSGVAALVVAGVMLGLMARTYVQWEAQRVSDRMNQQLKQQGLKQEVFQQQLLKQESIKQDVIEQMDAEHALKLKQMKAKGK